MRSPSLASFAVVLAASCSARSPSTVGKWTFKELLAPPSAAEIEAVDRTWPASTIADARVVETIAKSFEGVGAFQIRVVTHRTNGVEHCGFVFVPNGAAHASLTGLVDVRDIRWDYPPRDVSKGPFVITRILKAHAMKFAVIMPCLRGGSLRADGREVTARGDRRDAWEGAAADAIAFTSAALSITPEIDPSRLVAYGYSRGAGVALLIGQRDRRVRSVVAFAAPTDWFRAMTDQDGPWAERLADAATARSLPQDSLRSQFLDWFVRDRESLPLSELRRRLLASSPLYFVKRLPPTQVHHGENDSSVPVANAIALRQAAQVTDAQVDVRTYRGESHLIGERSGAYQVAQEFLLNAAAPQ